MSKSGKSVVKRGISLASRTFLPEFRSKRRSSFTMKCKGRKYSANWQCSPMYSGKRRERHVRTGFVYVQSSSQLKKTWKLHYAVLYADRLSYIQQSKTENFYDSFRGQQIKISNIVSLKVLKKHSQVRKNSLTNGCKSAVLLVKFVVHGKQTELLLRFQTPEETNEWMTALLMAKSSSLLGERTTSEKLAQRSASHFYTKL